MVVIKFKNLIWTFFLVFTGRKGKLQRSSEDLSDQSDTIAESFHGGISSDRSNR